MPLSFEQICNEAVSFPPEVKAVLIEKLLGKTAVASEENGKTQLTRITFNPKIMGGKPCIRGMRVTVGMIVGLVASGHGKTEILQLYPYLEPEDIDEALTYAAWRSEEIEIPLAVS